MTSISLIQLCLKIGMWWIRTFFWLVLIFSSFLHFPTSMACVMYLWTILSKNDSLGCVLEGLMKVIVVYWAIICTFWLKQSEKSAKFLALFSQSVLSIKWLVELHYQCKNMSYHIFQSDNWSILRNLWFRILSESLWWQIDLCPIY